MDSGKIRTHKNRVGRWRQSEAMSECPQSDERSEEQ